MPLSKEQRAKLLQELTPVVNDAIKEGARPIIQDELKRVTAEARDDAQSYSHKILSTQDQDRVRETESDPRKRGFGLARIAYCMARFNNDVEQAAHFAEQQDDADIIWKAVAKTLTSGDATAGGVLVPEELSSSFIEALTPRTAVRRAGEELGWVSLDMPSGNLRVGRETGRPTAGYKDENAASNASDMTTGDLNFVAKILEAKSSISNQLLRWSAQNAERVVRDGMVREMAITEDDAFLNGLGTANAPRGFRGWVQAANQFNVNATTNLTNVQTDLRSAMSNLEDNNVSTDFAAWFMRHRTRTFLAHQLRDQEDKPTFKGELTANPPMLNGHRAYFTNNIPANLDASGDGTNDESRIYFVAMDEVWLAESANIRVRASSEASFTDSTGTLISAFDRDSMVIAITREHDFAVAHPEAVSMMEAVDWGA